MSSTKAQKRGKKNLACSLSIGATSKQTIGLMGGSFNPAHSGHRLISELAIKRLGLNKVWWLVSPQNPLKSSAGMASIKERVQNAVKISRNPRIKVMTIESSLNTQYTVDLLKILSKRFSSARFIWIMGADNLLQFSKWKNWEEITSLVRIAIFDRPNFSLKSLAADMPRRFSGNRLREREGLLLKYKKPPAWIFFHSNLNHISATKIRSQIKINCIGD
tara:strand:+ start:2450 stop:3106 length:657 start_codon:yes stop_codon:yes gene_type:complete